MNNTNNHVYYTDLHEIAKNIRINILQMTTKAGSGHPTSSLSAVELMVCLLFGEGINGKKFFNCNWEDFNNYNTINDRLLFSKGHASPLFYSLFFELGLISLEELMTYRQFNSVLEGHPTPRFPYTVATTGSLGQGLGITLGLAMANRNVNHWVLLGDSEMAEGSIWESMALIAHNNLSNVIGIIDMNRLGQRGETMLGWDVDAMVNRVSSFGWKPVIINNGHDIFEVERAIEIAFNQAKSTQKPTMIIAKTVKGKGVSFLENKEGWHGKTLSEAQLAQALKEL
jgi:transketolase